MIGTKPTKGSNAYLTESGELVIPLNAPKRWQYARGGWNIPQILAELDAPLRAWRLHAYAGNLAPENHQKFCQGAVQQGNGFVFCVDCGRYQVEE